MFDIYIYIYIYCYKGEVGALNFLKERGDTSFNWATSSLE